MKESELKIVIVGTSGSGKSTLARKISDILECDHIELDCYAWMPDWTKKEDKVLLEDVKVACSRSSWVSCGNYSVTRDVVWGQATHLLWLRFPFPVVFWRILKRTMRRIIHKEPIAGGNIETFWQQFFTKDSIFLWIFKTHWRRVRVYSKILDEGVYPSLKVIVFRSQRQVDAWLEKLKKGEVS